MKLTLLPICALVGVAFTTTTTSAQDCTVPSVGLTPLIDMGTATYAGFEGGLYPDGSNIMPAAHAARGRLAAQRVRPLDANGNPNPQGKIALVGIGMSNARAMFDAWLSISDADPERNPALTVINAAQNGQDALILANPAALFWTNADQLIAQAGVTNEQVQVVWLKEAIQYPSGTFPASAQQLNFYLGIIVRTLKQRFVNLQICYMSSRSYGGYATIPLSPEPYAYEGGFAVKWLIDQQIAGSTALNPDPEVAPVLAPWLAWGPYIWADGTSGRSDGLRWFCGDYIFDGIHMTPNGRGRSGDLLNEHFTSDPTATPWYHGTVGPRAAVLPYGAGCSGGSGRLRIVSTSTPFLGNDTFDMKVENAPASTSAMLFWAATPAQIAFDGCTFLIDPTMVALVQPLVTNASGEATEIVTIPEDPTLSGQFLYAQWLVLDPSAAGLQQLGGAAMSDGIKLRVGA